METKTVKIPNVLRAKVAVVGETRVGKTALCQQLSSDGTNFPKNYLMTNCMEVHVKSVNIPDTNDIVELYLADCSGAEIYKNMLSEKCWPVMSMIVVMYDVCNEASFVSATKWLEQVRHSMHGNSAQDENQDQQQQARRIGVLLANKTDLTERRVVSPKLGSDMAQQLGLMYFECSCKDYTSVEDPFYYLANEFHKLHVDTTEQIATMG